MAIVINNPPPAGAGGMGSLLINPWEYSSITQGTWNFTLANSGIWCNGGATQKQWSNWTADAQNDQINYEKWMGAGTYTIRLFGSTEPDAGIVSVYIDGAKVGEIDLYSVGSVSYTTTSLAGVIISSTGLHTISLKIESKNAAGGTTYSCAYNHIRIDRTA